MTTLEPAPSTRSAPPLPGGVGLSRLRVYDWEGPDGLRGGSPHVHLVCSEAYLVLGGEGAVQTIGPAGFAETPVERGSLLWFTPGLVHRLINRGDLAIILSYVQLPIKEAREHKPRLVYVDAANQITRIANEVALSA